VWFQNRRIKWRKVHLEMQQERLRVIRSQETQDFEESSGSSSSEPTPSHRTFQPSHPFPPPPPLSSQSEAQHSESEDQKEGKGGEVKDTFDGMKSSDWDASLFDVDAYLLKKLGSLRPVPRWTGCPPCPSHVSSESDMDSD